VAMGTRALERALYRIDSPPDPALPVGSIREALDKIISSRTFREAAGQQRFLRYAVDETIHGRAHLIKEYSVGVAVFGRGESFDPRLDSIVRTEARRLRSRIARYYESEGELDLVRIEFPKGMYAPVFRLAEALDVAGECCEITAPEPRRLRQSVSIAVLPFIDMSRETHGEHFTDGLTEELINSLSQVPGLQVLARSSSFQWKGMTPDIVEIGRRFHVAAVLEGSVRRVGDRIRVSAQLNETVSGFHLWADSYDDTIGDIFAVQRGVAQSITASATIALVRGCES
jgi:TolB-like protein